MVSTVSEINTDIGFRMIRRPWDVFSPELAIHLFDSFCYHPVLWVYQDHQMVAEIEMKGKDCEPHDAFVHGHLPAFVYADWLEENWPDVPPVALRLLREQM